MGKFMTTKNPNAVALGSLGGKIGGKSTSPAKIAAARANVRKTKTHMKATNESKLIESLKSALRYIEVQTAYQGAMTCAEVESAIKSESFPASISIGANSCNTLASFDIRAARQLLADLQPKPSVSAR
jgi:hypothetical protein